MTLSLMAVSAAALGLSWLGVGALRAWALKRGVLDVPNERSSHARPTPRGGGAAIVVITLGGFLAGLAWHRATTFQAGCFAAGALLVAGVSAWDDLRSLPSTLRLVVHAAAAAVLLLGADLGGVAGAGPAWLVAGLAMVWVCGMVNAYNFMDGIDGIAATQGIVAGLTWLGLGWLEGRIDIALLGALLAMTCLGFLAHNRPPARIFMGDVGSAFLGYAFGALPLFAGGASVTTWAAGVCALWPFVFDAGFTLLRRLAKGENVLKAHRTHLYQRLIGAGMSHGRVTLLYGVLAVFGAGVGLAVRWARTPALLLVLLLAAFAFAAWVGRVERRRGVSS